MIEFNNLIGTLIDTSTSQVSAVCVHYYLSRQLYFDDFLQLLQKGHVRAVEEVII